MMTPLPTSWRECATIAMKGYCVIDASFASYMRNSPCTGEGSTQATARANTETRYILNKFFKLPTFEPFPRFNSLPTLANISSMMCLRFVSQQRWSQVCVSHCNILVLHTITAFQCLIGLIRLTL
uniref:Uncharacterized protein n=1 Tax=Anopheles atroparvus TaxID=41427 RepID=A0AAG5CV75_ANOAO